MKKLKASIIAVFLVFVFGFNGYTQGFWQWSDHYPLTDSSSDNRNPFLFTAYWNNSNTVYMFWEKSIDSLSTELWMNNLFDGLPPEMVLSDPGVHFTHPKIINAQHYPYPDSLFYVFYETNQNGNQDIYYTVYQPNGDFSTPEPLTSSPLNDTQLTVDRGMFSDANSFETNKVAWITEGQLFSSALINNNGQYFSEAVMIDSNICSSPTIGTDNWYGYGIGGIIYERYDSSTTYLYQSFYEGGGIWSSPEVFYDSNESKNPSRSGHYGMPCWSSLIDTNWRIISKDWENSNHLFEISKSTPFNPAVLGQVISVDGDIDLLWIAVTYPENNADEIYMNNYEYSPVFENFSNSGTPNRNPQFFNGEWLYTGCWYDYLVWESYRNGHWQIWASKVLQCMGNVDEEPVQESYISVHPNPFSHETTIEFTLNTPSDVLVEVYDNRGMQVAKISNQSFDQGDHQLRWNGSDLAAGLYIIKMTVGDRVYTTKLVKSR